MLQSDQIEANFGFSVASAGDVDGDTYADVIVGADEYDAGETGEGAAFVFRGSASGVPNQNAAGAGERAGVLSASSTYGVPSPNAPKKPKTAILPAPEGRRTLPRKTDLAAVTNQRFTELVRA